MKILSVENIRKADAYTIANEPIDSVDLMERASQACVDWISGFSDKKHKFIVFAGFGNNGGDALAIARLLIKKKYDVDIYIINEDYKLSTDCNINYDRLLDLKKEVHFIENNEFPLLEEGDIIIDGIFGSGLSRKAEGIFEEAITFINESGNIVISIDIPSGLFANESTIALEATAIQADYTLSFEFPKLAFLMSENESFVGQWQILPIGLHPDCMKEVKDENYLVHPVLISSIIKPRSKFTHKGSFGHALLIAGSLGKMGAAILAAKACLRSGAGLLTTHIPKSGNVIMQTAFPEAMTDIDSHADFITYIEDISTYNAIAIGPGIGNEIETTRALKLLIQNSSRPLIIDADALNILSEYKTWLSFLPAGSILTPHPGEFKRLAGNWENDFEKIEMQKELSMKFRIYIILKGANTSISCPDGQVYYNTSGNSGMATAGSGDVLTGILLGLFSQYYSPIETCLLGVYLHGLAGDLSAINNGMEATIASDIIDNIGKAWQELY